MRKNLEEKALLMTPVECAYLAGIVDGEGFISFAPRGTTSKGLIRMRVGAIGVSTTSTDLADWLTDKVGSNANLNKNTPKECKPNYNWRITNYRAVVVAQMIRPYLVIKGKQADLLIEHYNIRVRARQSHAMIRDFLGVRYTPKIVRELNEIHNRVFDLNARGTGKRSLAMRYICNGVLGVDGGQDGGPI